MPGENVPVRRAVSKLDRSGGVPAELADYAEGIKAMLALPEDDIKSLSYQAAIHGRTGRPDPGHPDWDWCQHRSWFFLPWHRMYLLEFERNIGSLINKTDWRLPYWDYNGDNQESWGLPPEFLSPPDENENPLFVEGREVSELIEEERDWSMAQDARPFVSSNVGIGFGGGRIDRPMQFPRGITGLLEGQPHNTIHSVVSGLMGNPLTAGFDPLFWLHHASIDHLWEVWLNQSDFQRSNPSERTWLDTQFRFPTGGDQFWTVAGALDTVSLGYVYDDIEPPAPTAFRELRRSTVARSPLEATVNEEPEPELIGATDGPVALDPGVTMAVNLETPASWGFVRRISSERGFAADEDQDVVATETALDGRVLLQLENVKGTSPSVGVYDVYVNVPEGEDPQEHPELKAGLFSTFGLEVASAEGHGVTQAFDITDVARLLYNEGQWDPKTVKVTMTSHSGKPKRSASANDVRAERVGVYVIPAASG